MFETQDVATFRTKSRKIAGGKVMEIILITVCASWTIGLIISA
jgi:hypothetical protein